MLSYNQSQGVKSTPLDHFQLRQMHLPEPHSLQFKGKAPSFTCWGTEGVLFLPGNVQPMPGTTLADSGSVLAAT